MAHTIPLVAAPRTVRGKQVKQLRHQGLVPANIYGHGVDSTPLQVDAKALQAVLHHATATTLIDLSVEGGRARPVLVRDIQWEPVRREPIHVDFFAVRMDEKIRATVSIVTRGESPAAKSSEAMLLNSISEVHVEGLPADLPETIEVDISGLTEIEQAIHVRDLQLPDNVTILDDPDDVVIKVQVVRAAVEEIQEAIDAASAEAGGDMGPTPEEANAAGPVPPERGEAAPTAEEGTQSA